MRAGALILAGGRSRRMGAPKPWLELHGRPLLVHVVERVARVCAPIVVVGAAGVELPALDPRVIRVDDPPELAGRGPLAGLVVGLSALAARGIEQAYLGACDAATLTESHVELVLARMRRGTSAAVIPVDSEGFMHPLAAAVRVEPVLNAARAAIDAGRWRLVELFENLARVERLGVDELPDPRVLEPCNTPAQWAALVRED